MTRLALIFAITFLMVMQAHADPRRGDGGGWHGGGGGHGWGGGGGWNRPNVGPVWRPRGYGYGGGYNFGAGVLGGAIGGFLWRQWNTPQANEEWCAQRYRSYDPYTKTYLGFDGLRHGCP